MRRFTLQRSACGHRDRLWKQIRHVNEAVAVEGVALSVGKARRRGAEQFTRIRRQRSRTRCKRRTQPRRLDEQYEERGGVTGANYTTYARSEAPPPPSGANS